MALPLGWELAKEGAGLLSNIFGIGSQSDIERKKAEEEAKQRAFENEMMMSRRTAYGNMLKTGGQMAGAGEAGFMAEAGKAPTSLEQAKQDILSGSARGIQQAGGAMQAQMAQSGIRGGQAGTLLNRGIGSMGIQTQEQLNKLGLEDEQRRKDAIMAYQAAKAGRGQTAQLAPAMY